MPSILLTLGLALAFIACVAADILGTAPAVVTETGSRLTGQLDFAEAAAITSGVFGLLAWFPLLPVMQPAASASVAILAGLLSLRHLAGQGQRRRDRRIAVLGLVAGAANLILRLAVRLPA